MKTFAILVLVLISFHSGTDALQCYNDMEEREVVTCDEDEECLLITNMNDQSKPPRANGCSPEVLCPDCRMCDTDLCNALKCYNSKEKMREVCGFEDICITDHSTDERKCGRCEGSDPDKCEPCNEHMCNKRPPLKCYQFANEEVQCDDDRDDGTRQKCVTITKNKRVIEKHCGFCEEIALPADGSEQCEDCNTEKCNDKPFLSLNCYDSKNQVIECENPRDKCLTFTEKLMDDERVEKKCGICDELLEDRPAGTCEQCDSDKCNDKRSQPYSCYNATDQLNKCEKLHDKCITIMDNGRAVDKKCGSCDEIQRGSEKCVACEKDECNKQPKIQHLTCYINNTNQKQCEDVRDHCFTRKKNHKGFALVQEKGCGRCNAKDEECIPCFQNGCNNGTIEDKFECYAVDQNLQKTVRPCGFHGLKCIVAYTKDRRDEWVVDRGCSLCPTKLEPGGICHQCNKSLCNDFQWPKCKAGAANGAGDFFVERECKQNLKLNKDMNITATCIKQQVEGITYKDCGSCGAFVHPVTDVDVPLPKDANINKCHECVSTEGAEHPCNGVLAHHVPVLLLVIGACMPWLMLSPVSPFAGV